MDTRCRNKNLILAWSVMVGLGLLRPEVGWVQGVLSGVLENPGVLSVQSGIGVISGWVCEAERVEVEIENLQSGQVVRLEPAYGTSRADTEEMCGDGDNGFGLLWNWNLLGDGAYTLQLLVDGVPFGQAVTFTVTTLGLGEFPTGLSKQAVIMDFPAGGRAVEVVWQESLQSFTLTGGGSSGGGGGSSNPRATLENPAPGSSQSGIGVISGWVCEAERVEVEIENLQSGQVVRLEPAYGTSRADTEEMCGDGDNGFGLLWNWNLLGDGGYRIRALADGVEFASAEFGVTTLGLGEFPTGLEELASAQATLTDFPAVGTDVRVQWQDRQQNFILEGVLPPGRSQNVCTTQLGEVEENGLTGLFTAGNPCTRTAETFDLGVVIGGTVQVRGERAQGTAEGFLVCVDNLQIMQGGRVFTSADFRWLDGQGERICQRYPAGTEIKGIVVVNPGVSLNFGEPFEVLYNQTPVAEFASSPMVLPLLALSTDALDFGSVEVGRSSERVITVTNSGGGILEGSATTTAPFSIVTRGSFRLEAGQSQVITVRFSPTSAEPVTGSVSITSNGGNATVTLSGAGTATPMAVLSVSSDVLSFSSVSVGETEDLSFTVTNEGNVDLTVSATLCTETSGAFSLVSGGPFRLAPGASQNITVRFKPPQQGSFQGCVDITSNGGNDRVDLSGASNSCKPLGEALSHDFGDVLVGSSSSYIEEGTITNSSSETIEVCITLSDPQGVFNFDSGEGCFSGGPGQVSYSYQVRFAPPQQGTFSATVNIDTSEGCTVTNLSGRGVEDDT